MWSILSAYVNWNGIKLKNKIIPFIIEGSQFRKHNIILKFKVGCIDKQFFKSLFKTINVNWLFINKCPYCKYICTSIYRVMV